MVQDFAADDHPSGPFSDVEMAQIALELDRVITRSRRARIVEGRPVSLPVKPTCVELAVFTALAQTYGPALLSWPSFTPVFDCIAERGAVVLVQRSLWGERPDDVRLAARLLAARVPFEILCGTWPEVFMAQAQAELQGFRPQLPKSPMASDGEEGGDD